MRAARPPPSLTADGGDRGEELGSSARHANLTGHRRGGARGHGLVRSDTSDRASCVAAEKTLAIRRRGVAWCRGGHTTRRGVVYSLVITRSSVHSGQGLGPVRALSDTPVWCKHMPARALGTYRVACNVRVRACTAGRCCGVLTWCRPDCATVVCAIGYACGSVAVAVSRTAS